MGRHSRHGARLAALVGRAQVPPPVRVEPGPAIAADEPDPAPVNVSPSTDPGNVLTRPTDPTQVISRIRPSHTTTDITTTDITPTADTHTAGAPNDADDKAADAHNEAEVATEGNTRHRWQRGWVWVGLAAFWLLALGAGLITLASLGAPHFLCTGTSSTGLACETTGTVLAAILTVVLIVAVGSVSVLAIEKRAHVRTAWRWLGMGAIALIVVSSCGYLLIRTIGG